MDEDHEFINRSLKFCWHHLKRFKYNFKLLIVIFYYIIAFTGTVNCEPVTANRYDELTKKKKQLDIFSVSKIGDELSRYLSKTFTDATKWEDVKRVSLKFDFWFAPLTT